MIRIEITVPDEVASDRATGATKRYLDSCMAALGYAPAVGAALPSTVFKEEPRDIYKDTAEALYAQGGHGERFVESVVAVSEAATKAGYGVDGPLSGDVTHTPNVGGSLFGNAATDTAAPKPARERGKAGEGRTRRTKEEIAEDKAADEADAARGNISTSPENRVDPAAEEAVDPTAVDDAATTAQDEADERAEQEARTTPGKLTVDDIREAMREVGSKHGMPVAVKIPGYLGGPIAEIPEANYAKAIEDIRALLELTTDEVKEFLGVSAAATKPVETAKTTESVAKDMTPKKVERTDLIAAMFRYAEFADQTRDVNKMVFTQEDLPKLFKPKFGVEAQADIPDDKLEIAIFLIDEAIASDQFGRRKK